MRYLAVLLITVILAACQFSGNRHLTRKVRSAELIGNWQATEFGIKSLRQMGVRDHLAVRDHSMTLRADGSCELRTIMNMPLLENAEYRTYDAGCRWRIVEIGHQALEFELKPAPPVGTPYYYFTEEDGRLLLRQYATDPDRWLYMEFERRGA